MKLGTLYTTRIGILKLFPAHKEKAHITPNSLFAKPGTTKTKSLTNSHNVNNMKTHSSITGIRSRLGELKSEDQSIAFVPTMGYFHEGHLSLFRAARERADIVVASIYVNPTQFGPDEDFDDYPRDMERDLELAEQEGVSEVFTPSDEIMYPSEHKLSIQIDQLADHLCGASRDGHFEGVLLVVNKLFNIIEPDVAVFGQKDIQQFVLIQRMVEEFNHNIELIRAPIARANDGLALSSRNTYLTEQERVVAPGLYRCLKYLKKQIEDGVSNILLILNHQKAELEQKGFDVDYLSVVNYNDLFPVENVEEGKTYIIAVAAYLGETRLIDNMIVKF